MDKDIITFTDLIINYEGIAPKKSKDYFSSILPLNLESDLACEFAYLIGKVMGDGHLDQLYTTRFISPDYKDLNSLRDLLIKKLNIEPFQMTIRKKFSKGQAYVLQVNNSAFGRVLYALGAPKGNKTETEFLIPFWIRSCTKLSKYFLQALLEDELTTIRTYDKAFVKSVRFNMNKSVSLKDSFGLFFDQLKDLIESFGVNCSKTSELKPQDPNKTTYYFRIKSNKRNVIAFASRIGFRFNKNKVLHLQNTCKILKATLKPIIDTDEVLKLRNEGLSIRQIAIKLNVGNSRIHRILLKM
ncbi:MAG: hypothetical protein ABIH53_04910 [archaeon]